MWMDLREIARMLGGQVVGDQVLCPGPGHSTKDRSLAVRLSRCAPSGLVTYSHAGDDQRICRAYVLSSLGYKTFEKTIRRNQYDPPTSHRLTTNALNQTQAALQIWQQGRDPAGTPVMRYLKQRSVTIPECAAGVTVRYHPACPFAGTKVPAMVCLVRDILTDEPVAIHRTALSLDGRKVRVGHNDRLCLGPIAGGAIKLTPDAEVSICLGIGEGIETTLSLRRCLEFGGSSVWSLISAGGLRNFPVLSGIESLWVAVDNDRSGVGQRAARSTGLRWQAAGAEVFLLKPRALGNDLNDLFNAGLRHVQL